jgi:anti-sigma B factor antagonist
LLLKQVLAREEEWRQSFMSEQSGHESPTNEDVPIVVLEGEVDLAVAPNLQEQLDALIAGGQSTIVVDLLGATFLDSIALGVLVGTLEECRDTGGDLHLVVTDHRILKVLEITGLTETFPIHSTWPEHSSEVLG